MFQVYTEPSLPPHDPKKLLAHILWKFLSLFSKNFFLLMPVYLSLSRPTIISHFGSKTKTSVMQKIVLDFSNETKKNKMNPLPCHQRISNYSGPKSTQKVFWAISMLSEIFFHQKRITFHSFQSVAVPIF